MLEPGERADWGSALAPTNKVHGIGGQPLVQPDGTVVVPFDGFSARLFLQEAFTSTDGGASWGPARVLAPVFYHTPAGGIPLPSAEIDQSGKVYVVWPDCRFEPGCSYNDLVLSTTTDGRIWSPVTRIPANSIGSGIDHFIPGLAVDRSTFGNGTHLVLAFYYYPVANCTTATCRLDVGYTSSADGGATWTANSQLAGCQCASGHG